MSGSGAGCAASEPYALQVLDDSMEPEFASGCIVVVDPAGLIKPGAFVIAWNGEEYTFRQLWVEPPDQYFLKPLNARHPTFILSSLADIKGVVIQRAGKRRSYSKRYD